MYGGGPIIVREDDDIYSSDISGDLMLTSKRPKTGAAVKKGASASGNNIFMNQSKTLSNNMRSASPAVGGAQAISPKTQIV